MKRSFDQLTNYATGEQFASSDVARDALFHFFQDALHLGDWLVNDNRVQISKVEIHGNGQDKLGLLKTDLNLALCGDLANGTKHFKLSTANPKTGDLNTAFVGQGVTVRPGVATAGGPEIPPEAPSHNWTVESNGAQYDALKLAASVMAAWSLFLKDNGLTIPDVEP